ncbi:MAG: hypothetical protein HY078_13670 [Elusimicrobia bacterium]|nr:hypothetical protein [Elusimicrobiota bacterium]
MKSGRTANLRLYRALLAAFAMGATLAFGLVLFLIWDLRQANDAWKGVPPGHEFLVRGGLCVCADKRMVAEPFPCPKPKGELRVFVVGSSEAMGTPYVNQRLTGLSGALFSMPNEGGLSTWLERYLKKLLPGRAVRVVNAAKGGRDLSASVAVVREALELGEPDAIVLLDGNNERVSPLIDSVDLKPGADLSTAVSGLTRQFERALSDAAGRAEAAKVPLYVLTVPNNLRDWLPLPARPAVDAEKELAALATEAPARAIERLRARAKAEPKEPLHRFLLGRALERSGDHAAARDAYVAAKDLDRRFLRTRTVWNEAIRKAGGAFTKRVDLERAMFAYSKSGIPGADLFLDYCHMTLAANRAAAFEIAKAINAGQLGSKEPLALEDATLDLFTKSQLRRLYRIKRLKWLASRWLSARAPVDALNFRQEAEQYAKQAELIDQQIDLLARPAPR